jgi:TonB family protein
MKRLYAIALLLMLTVPATAQLEQRWAQLTKETVDHLKAERYDRALQLSNKMIREMVEKLGPGQAAYDVFGRTLTYKALAHAGLGQQDDALWWWHSVLAIYPAFAKSDLSGFGKAGAFLKANTSVPREGIAKAADANVTAPRVRKTYEPVFPAGAQWFGIAGVVIVEVVITKEGTVTAPQILKTLPAPTVAYATLDAVQRWRFEPGKVDGRPVNVIFKLTVNYKM